MLDSRRDPRAWPPGPRSALLSTIRYLRDPFGSLLATAARYGDPFSWPSFLGKVVITADPIGIQQILTADPAATGPLGAELLAPVLGASNLILMSGEAHRVMRRFYGPQFHGEGLRQYGAIIARIAAEHVARWPRARPFAVDTTMRAIALDVMLEGVLGLGEPGARAVFKDALLKTVRALKPSFMFLPALRRPLLGLSAWARFQRRAAETVALFEREVDARRATDRPRLDVLSALIAARKPDGTPFSGGEIMEQIVSLLGAGHETTASALSWAFFHIHRSPFVKGRLLDELRTLGSGAEPSAVTQLPFLDAVCAETLRLTPVAPLIGRKLRAPLTVKGVALAAGQAVGVSVVGVHRRPDLYPDPERFRPERFLEREYGPFEYLPFGGGSRRCLGASLATYEMKIVLATALRAHKLRLTHGGELRAAARNTTSAPARSVTLISQP